ncbi:uncharacterized protein ACWYII_019801 isoform 1-T2 [Salvelinus alpinus]
MITTEEAKGEEEEERKRRAGLWRIFSTLMAILALWFGISVPLSLRGRLADFGFKRPRVSRRREAAARGGHPSVEKSLVPIALKVLVTAL